MKLVCPECGATASASSWVNDAEVREVLAAVVKLPGPVAAGCLPYLGLFRPGSRALAWKRARTLVAELSALVSPGHVQIQGKVARPCPPSLWVRAMDEMVARRDRLQLPVKNHNYLRQIAWGLAEAADAAGENRRHQDAAAHHLPAARREEEEDDGLLPIEREMMRRGLAMPRFGGQDNAD